MTNLMERLKAWNLQMNGLPRKAWLIVLTLLFSALFILLAFFAGFAIFHDADATDPSL